MKRHIALILATSLAALQASAHENNLQPRHGGVVVEVRDVEYELVARTDRLALHVRDHGKTMAPAQAKARVTLLAGTARTDVDLRPSGDHFAATGTFTAAPGTKAVAILTMPGQAPVTARFTLR